MSFLRHKLFLAVVLGHFTVDVFASMGPVVVTFLSKPMALSGAQIGLALGTHQLIGAVTQPFFGWLTDRVGSRWLGPVSVAWIAGFTVLAVLVAQVTHNFSLFLICFGLAALGVGGFHPQGTMHAGTAIAGQAATATGVFFLFGQGGLASGPFLAGLILENIGPIGIYALAFLITPLLIFMIYAMRHASPQPVSVTHHPSAESVMTKEAVRWGAISLRALLAGLRAWVFLGTASFLPKMFQDMGWEVTAYGSITGTYWLASAIAGVIGGHLADRWGRRQVVFVTLLLGSIALYFLPLSDGWQAFPLAIISGCLLGASHSILVVIAQALLPGRKAFVSGVTLGYVFGTGALATWVIGNMADIWGLNPVIQAGAGVGVLTALLALVLPATREAPHSQSETTPA
jgi:FSR family fosmidomycin resistance protein-like MFS transporter